MTQENKPPNLSLKEMMDLEPKLEKEKDKAKLLEEALKKLDQPYSKDNSQEEINAHRVEVSAQKKMDSLPKDGICPICLNKPEGFRNWAKGLCKSCYWSTKDNLLASKPNLNLDECFDLIGPAAYLFNAKGKNNPENDVKNPRLIAIKFIDKEFAFDKKLPIDTEGFFSIKGNTQQSFPVPAQTVTRWSQLGRIPAARYDNFGAELKKSLAPFVWPDKNPDTIRYAWDKMGFIRFCEEAHIAKTSVLRMAGINLSRVKLDREITGLLMNNLKAAVQRMQDYFSVTKANA